jgi:hypothetical protein
MATKAFRTWTVIVNGKKIATTGSEAAARRMADEESKKDPSAKVGVQGNKEANMTTRKQPARRKAADEPEEIQNDLENPGNPQELVPDEAEKDDAPFEPKHSAMEAAKAHGNLKAIKDYFGEGGDGDLSKMDHPQMRDGLKALVEDDGPVDKCMSHIKDLIGEHHSELGDPDEALGKMCKSIDEIAGTGGQPYDDVTKDDLPGGASDAEPDLTAGVEEIKDDSFATGEDNLVGSGAIPEGDLDKDESDPDTEEILERYQNPKTSKWETRKAGIAWRAKNGRVYVKLASHIRKGPLDQLSEYDRASADALKRRLALLDDAYKRGVHTKPEYDRLHAAILQEQHDAWHKKGFDGQGLSDAGEASGTANLRKMQEVYAIMNSKGQYFFNNELHGGQSRWIDYDDGQRYSASEVGESLSAAKRMDPSARAVTKPKSKQLANATELNPGEHDVPDEGIVNGTLTKAAGDAAEHLEAAAGDPSTPAMHKSAHSYHAAALRKALDDEGNEQELKDEPNTEPSTDLTEGVPELKDLDEEEVKGNPGDKCPQCGGTLRDNGAAIVCVSCGFVDDWPTKSKGASKKILSPNVSRIIEELRASRLELTRKARMHGLLNGN